MHFYSSPMASTTTQLHKPSNGVSAVTDKPPRPKLACFSFAAYSKNLINHLKSLNIPILPGLTDAEFKSIETTFKFSFPPDLRFILQEGLPVSHGFPNWRSASFQQLSILVNLPKFFLLKAVSEKRFWCRSWGDEPTDSGIALATATKLLESAPALVPIYRDCYIPSEPELAGNPVFYIHGGDFRVLSFDLSGFFQRVEFLHVVGDFGLSSECLPKMARINAPAWTATAARRVEFWTEVAEGGGRLMTRGVTRGWWSEGGLGLDGCLNQVFWRLREGGWGEEEVKEMMMMDGPDEKTKSRPHTTRDIDGWLWHLRLLSLSLLRAGWTREDVVYSLDLRDNMTPSFLDWESSTFDFRLEHPTTCFHVDDHKRSTIRQLMHLHSLEL